MIDQVFGFFGQRRVYRDEIAFYDRFFQPGFGDAQFFSPVFGQVRIVCDHVHPECFERIWQVPIRSVRVR